VPIGSLSMVHRFVERREDGGDGTIPTAAV
jgi:hypothetical protein